IVSGVGREGVLAGLAGKKNVGIELGVAAGSFSAKMTGSEKFAKVFGVDTYDDYYHHIDEYREALSAVGLATNYSLLRMTFEQARELFPGEFFDFVYVDGFAHTGQEGGQTLADWFPTVKVGGVMAGDDYHDDWPLVQWAVNDFAGALGVELKQTERTEGHSYNRYPSWYFVKTAESEGVVYQPHPELRRLADEEKKRIGAHRRAKGRARAVKNLKKRLLRRS
ncbi:MAG: class I SAM-dependent methyltransferase, partial [Pontimonas sp.]